jgi:hypothetical protein
VISTIPPRTTVKNRRALAVDRINSRITFIKFRLNSIICLTGFHTCIIPRSVWGSKVHLLTNKLATQIPHDSLFGLVEWIDGVGLEMTEIYRMVIVEEG